MSTETTKTKASFPELLKYKPGEDFNFSCKRDHFFLAAIPPLLSFTEISSCFAMLVLAHHFYLFVK